MIAQFLDGLVFKIQQKRIRKYLEEQKLTSASVLDLGCGYGWYSQLFDGHYTGIDNDPERLEIAKNKYPGKNFLEMSADALSFPDQSFDLAVSFLVLHHLTEQQLAMALSEVRRVLRPGGRFLVTDLVVPEKLAILSRPLMWLDNAERRSHQQLSESIDVAGLGTEHQKNQNYGVFALSFFDSSKK